MFQEQIRCLNSHNSELRGQLEVLSSRTRDSSGSGSNSSAAESHCIVDTPTSMDEATSSSNSSNGSSRFEIVGEEDLGGDAKQGANDNAAVNGSGEGRI